jgi:hypothetical protein
VPSATGALLRITGAAQPMPPLASELLLYYTHVCMVSKVMMLSPTAKFCTGCSSNILQVEQAAAAAAAHNSFNRLSSDT